MIARIRDLVRRAGDRYHDLERRVLAGRIGRWSQRRRLVVLTMLPVLVCCCGGVLGVPAVWVLRTTVEAGRGEQSPAAAANTYLLALGYSEQEGLLPLLDDAAEDELLRQWAELRTAMAATEPWGAPSRLNVGNLDEGPIVDGQATVTAEVSATWWGRGGTPGTSVESEPLPWRIVTRDDDGWRVVKVEPPPWCGPGGYVVRCPGDPAPSPAPSSAVSPTPSPGILDRLQSRHPCGPFGGASCSASPS